MNKICKYRNVIGKASLFSLFYDSGIRSQWFIIIGILQELRRLDSLDNAYGTVLSATLLSFVFQLEGSQISRTPIQTQLPYQCYQQFLLSFNSTSI